MIAFPQPAIYTAQVAFLKQLTKKNYIARFTLPQGTAFSFIAGQYCSFIIEQTVRRSFSLTSLPSDTGGIDICADITPMGPGSRWILDLTPGAEIRFLGPIGRFVFDTESPREKVFVATGTGIAPFRSMIMDALAAGYKGPITLVWGLRYEEDVFWDAEFQALLQQYPNLSYTLTLSRPTDGWEGKRGRVTEHLFAQDDMVEKEYYVCGSRAMVDGVIAGLLEHKVPENQIKKELFY